VPATPSKFEGKLDIEGCFEEWSFLCDSAKVGLSWRGENP
jgi:hypothetical protein